MARESESKLKIDKIYVYPIKALRAVELPSAQVTKHGFPHDRRFMLLHVVRDAQDDAKITYKNIHVAHYPESVRFFPSLDLQGDLVTITHRPAANGGAEKSIDVPLYPYIDDLKVVDVEMHQSPVQAYQMPQQYNDWLTECYGFEVVLAYLGPNYRPIRFNGLKNKDSSNNRNGNASSSAASSWLSTATSLLLPSALHPTPTNPPPSPEITFADCAPYLLVSQTSADDLQPRLPATSPPFDILKFRPNIVISGAGEPWEEDFWSQITILPQSSDSSSSFISTKIDCVHNCGRCKSINIDYTTGAPGTGPEGAILKAMQKDRRVDPGMKYSPIFGRYSFLHHDDDADGDDEDGGGGSEGNVIHVGDRVVVSKRLEERSRFEKVFIFWFLG
ncbi:related to MOSC domain [Lecanosticta acicola]|uniref:Related to MOSC domain n=1 Tax=Lecanosticta acicola TaxID=111012 RepID=A0AAI8YZT1_9PEZI|nr:related to MOSC domain [Lecanosticta acicola]